MFSFTIVMNTNIGPDPATNDPRSDRPTRPRPGPRSDPTSNPRRRPPHIPNRPPPRRGAVGRLPLLCGEVQVGCAVCARSPVSQNGDGIERHV